MKRSLIYVAIALLVALGIYFVSNKTTKVEETQTQTDSNTFYYNAYSIVDDSTNIISARHMESGRLYISETLITVDRGAGQINYIIDEMIYDEDEQTYLFCSNKSDLIFDPTNRTLTVLRDGIQFHINSTIKSNW